MFASLFRSHIERLVYKMVATVQIATPINRLNTEEETSTDAYSRQLRSFASYGDPEACSGGYDFVLGLKVKAVHLRKNHFRLAPFHVDLEAAPQRCQNLQFLCRKSEEEVQFLPEFGGLVLGCMQSSPRRPPSRIRAMMESTPSFARNRKPRRTEAWSYTVRVSV